MPTQFTDEKNYIFEDVITCAKKIHDLRPGAPGINSAGISPTWPNEAFVFTGEDETGYRYLRLPVSVRDRYIFNPDTRCGDAKDDDGCCTSESPCSIGEGDCDTADQVSLIVQTNDLLISTSRDSHPIATMNSVLKG